MVNNRMNIKEKIISYGKEHPKDKKIVIALLAGIIFMENIKKTVLSGIGREKTRRKKTLTEVGDMNEHEEQSSGYYTSVRNVEYNSEQVKKQLKPVNRAVMVPVALVCIAAVGMTAVAGNGIFPVKVSARESQVNAAADAETVVNLLEQPDAQEMEPAVVTKTETQTSASVEESSVIDNDALPWNLILVNDDYPIPEDYQVELVYVEGKQVDKRIEEDLKDMLKAAKAAGMNCKICSGYRTSAKQESLVKKDVQKYKAKGYDEEEALKLTYEGVSPVDHSEHQTGLTVDIVSASHQSLDAAHANTKEAIWLKEHCMEYGFIVRYMEGKEDITHRKAESWHFRYVGVEAATYIMENDITLEEYLEEYIAQN